MSQDLKPAKRLKVEHDVINEAENGHTVVVKKEREVDNSKSRELILFQFKDLSIAWVNFLTVMIIHSLIFVGMCPYLDTIDRAVLDFDFEKLCSVSLSRVNVYACLVCGKYFQVTLTFIRK